MIAATCNGLSALLWCEWYECCENQTATGVTDVLFIGHLGITGCGNYDAVDLQCSKANFKTMHADTEDHER